MHDLGFGISDFRFTILELGADIQDPPFHIWDSAFGGRKSDSESANDSQYLVNEDWRDR